MARSASVFRRVEIHVTQVGIDADQGRLAGLSSAEVGWPALFAMGRACAASKNILILYIFAHGRMIYSILIILSINRALSLI